MSVTYAEQFTITIKPVPRRGILQLAPGQEVTGYGRKISSDYKAWLPDVPRPYRVYAVRLSNSASHFIVRHGQTLFLQSGELDYQIEKARERRAMRRITAKLAKMRKPQQFSIYPVSDDGKIIVQSDRAIGQFDPTTRKGVLNYKGGNAKYFPHLSPLLGAEDFEFSEEFVAACVAAQPQTKNVEL